MALQKLTQVWNAYLTKIIITPISTVYRGLYIYFIAFSM